MKVIMEEDDWQLVIVTNEEARRAYVEGNIRYPRFPDGVEPPRGRSPPVNWSMLFEHLEQEEWVTLYCNKHKYFSRGYCIKCKKDGPKKLIEALQFLEQMYKV